MGGIFETLSRLEWASPWQCLWLLLIPSALWWRRSRGVPTLRLSTFAFLPAHAGHGVQSSRRRFARLPWLMQGLGLAMLVAALARPLIREPLPQTREGIDILLCLDVSSSMTEDFAVTGPGKKPVSRGGEEGGRLMSARRAGRSFLSKRQDDRVGLIAFARYADLRCPLTKDHRALSELLSRVEAVRHEGPEDATGIGTAVAKAARVLAKSEERSRVIVLLTDGVENVATVETPEEIAPVHAGQLCRDLEIKVYCISVGASGEVDTTQIKRLAESTGGTFFSARDEVGMTGAYAQIDELERSEISEQTFRFREVFFTFLVTGSLLLFFGRALAVTVFRVLP